LIEITLEVKLVSIFKNVFLGLLVNNFSGISLPVETIPVPLKRISPTGTGMPTIVDKLVTRFFTTGISRSFLTTPVPVFIEITNPLPNFLKNSFNLLYASIRPKPIVVKIKIFF
jgi:hypothetical protein